MSGDLCSAALIRAQCSTSVTLPAVAERGGKTGGVIQPYLTREGQRPKFGPSGVLPAPGPAAFVHQPRLRYSSRAHSVGLLRLFRRKRHHRDKAERAPPRE